jgi:hypothetical protein
VRALGEIRTHTGGVLNAVPLPLGYEGWECEKPPDPGSFPVGGWLSVADGRSEHGGLRKPEQAQAAKAAWSRGDAVHLQPFLGFP